MPNSRHYALNVLGFVVVNVYLNFITFKESHTLSVSHVLLFGTSWTVAHQTPLSKEFPRQEYWSGLPFPSPGDLPNPGIKSRSPALQVDSLLTEPPGNPRNTGVGISPFSKGSS